MIPADEENIEASPPRSAEVTATSNSRVEGLAVPAFVLERTFKLMRLHQKFNNIRSLIFSPDFVGSDLAGHHLSDRVAGRLFGFFVLFGRA